MGPYFRLGTFVGRYEIGKAQAQEFIKKNYNSITCEQEMLPDSIVAGVNGDEVEISLNNASAILKFAEQNGIGVRGNTFVYYSMTPQSLFTDNLFLILSFFHFRVRLLFSSSKSRNPHRIRQK